MKPEQVKQLLDEFVALQQKRIPPIGDAQLEQLLDEAEAVAKKELLKDQCLAPFARLIIPAPADTTPHAFEGGSAWALPGGQLAVLHLPLPMPNNAGGKAQMFACLRTVSRTLASMAVIVVSDAFTLWDEQAGRPGTSKEGYDFANTHGSAAAARAGYGTLSEVINASAQTRDRMILRATRYERRFKGGVLSPNGQNPMGVPHTVTILDNPWIMRCPQDYAPSPSNMVLIYEGALG